MKRVFTGLILVVALIAAFAIGAMSSMHFISRPLVENQLSHQRAMFYDQVVALKKLSGGANHEAEQVLRSLNIYSLLLFTLDEGTRKTVAQSPGLREVVAYACNDIISHLSEAKERASDKAEIEQACHLLETTQSNVEK